jgi:hypothetical protein
MRARGREMWLLPSRIDIKRFLNPKTAFRSMHSLQMWYLLNLKKHFQGMYYESNFTLSGKYITLSPKLTVFVYGLLEMTNPSIANMIDGRFTLTSAGQQIYDDALAYYKKRHQYEITKVQFIKDMDKFNWDTSQFWSSYRKPYGWYGDLKSMLLIAARNKMGSKATKTLYINANGEKESSDVGLEQYMMLTGADLKKEIQNKLTHREKMLIAELVLDDRYVALRQYI